MTVTARFAVQKIRELMNFELLQSTAPSDQLLSFTGASPMPQLAAEVAPAHNSANMQEESQWNSNMDELPFAECWNGAGR